jgi:anti-sigma B factor antagonist
MGSVVRRRLADDGSAVVTVEGEIDFSNADEVSRSVQEAVAEWSPSSVRVDLGAATFIDSTGLGALIGGYRAAIESGIGFVVLNPGSGFRRVLSVTGLCELFGVSDDASAEDIAI